MDSIKLDFEELDTLASNLTQISLALSAFDTLMTDTGVCTGDDNLEAATIEISQCWPQLREKMRSNAAVIQGLLRRIKDNFQEVDRILGGNSFLMGTRLEGTLPD